MKNKKMEILISVVAVIIGIAVLAFIFVGRNNSNDDKNPTNNNNVVGNLNQDDEQENNANIVSGESYDNFKERVPEDLQEFATVPYTIGLYLNSSEDASYENYGFSSLIGDLKSNEKGFSSLSYALKDLNNDGKEEMMIFNSNLEDENVIVSMYTMSEISVSGESGDTLQEIPMHLFNSHEDMLYKLYDNNVIRVEFISEDNNENSVNYDFLKLNEDLKFESIAVDEKNNIDPEKIKEFNNQYKEVILEKSPMLK